MAGTIDMPLGRSLENRLRQAVVPAGRPDARHAVTHYEVKKSFKLEDADEPIWLGDTETSKFLGGSSISDEVKKRKLPLCCKQPQSMIIT